MVNNKYNLQASKNIDSLDNIFFYSYLINKQKLIN